MRPSHLIVTCAPLAELWNDGGPMDARRLNWIGDMEIVDLLREEASFVVADVGHPLRRIQVADRFTFWKKEVQPHLAPPDTVGF
jgi:hypothetical protein